MTAPATLRAAVVGCGLIGARRAAALVDRGADVAVYDTDSARAEALAASLGAQVSMAPDQASAFAGADVAVVATPHHMLAPLAIEAVRAGCHVLVEKPGAERLEPLEELAKAAVETDRVVRVGFNHRFHPAVLEARELIAAGDYGPVMHIRARYGHGGRLGYEREWRADRAVAGGGELLDQGSHLVDLTRFFGGDVTLAFSEIRTDFWNMEVEDNAFLALCTSTGGFAWLHASWTEWKNLFSFEIAMRSAKIEIEGLGGSYGTERLTLHEMSQEMGPPRTSTREWPNGDGSWAAELDDALGAFEGRSGIGASLDDALAVMRVVDEVYAR